MRVNGVQEATVATDQGTGNYPNAVLYIGRRAGTSLPANMGLYQLTVRGAATADLTPGEAYTADKTGIGAPVNVSPPAITGTAQSGSTLTCSTGTWSNAGAFTYQWLDTGTPLIGATSSTLLLTDANKSHQISCVVTCTGFGVESAQSNTVTVSLFPYTGTWAYTTPATGSVPGTGQVQHADNFLNKFNVSNTNSSGGLVNFDQLLAGDTITFNGQTYTVQAPAQIFTGYAAISIDPPTQQPDGTYTVVINR